MLKGPGPRGGEPMIKRGGWALALGASSGFGEATSLALARAGLNIFGVHLDRKATLGNVERIVAAIKALGREAVFFNVNAADPDKRAEVVGQMERVLEERGEPGALRLLRPGAAGGARPGGNPRDRGPARRAPPARPAKAPPPRRDPRRGPAP